MVYSAKVMKAARAVIQSRDNISHRSRRPGTAVPVALSVRKSAEKYRVSKSHVDRAIQLLIHTRIPAPLGRPLLLNEAEDDALVAYVTWMQQGGFPATKLQFEGATNALLRRRNPDSPPVSQMWYRRWIDAHPHLKITHVKAIERSRGSFEQSNIKIIENFFAKLEMIVYPTESWAEMEGEDDLRFCRTDTGFSNSDIAFEWLYFFNRYSWEKSARAQRTGKSFIEWFGRDEWCRDPMTGEEKEGISRPKADRIFRLLVIDGFTGHTTLEFIEYCIEFDIVVAVFPPHSTHILQPLDVGVFQPLKNSQQKVLRALLQSSLLNFSRLDFLTSFKRTYDEGFTRHNIITGFEKSGIYPPSSGPAIRALLDQQRKQRKAINPAYASLLPQEFRFQLAADTIEDMTHRYHDILSSPTREGLRLARQVMTEASVLESNVKHFIEDRQQRLERLNNRIRKAAKSAEKEAEAEHRRHLRVMKKFVTDNIKALREEYRQNKKQEIDGKVKTLSYQKWLEHTGKADAFLEMDTQNKEFQQCLKQPRFFYDTERNPLLQEAIQEASRAPRPLLAFNFPPSDASVNIITAREDEDEEECSDSLSGLNSYEEYEDLELQDNTFEETQFESIFDAADEQRLPSLPPASSPPSSPPATPLSTPCRIVKSFKMHITDNLRTPRSNSIYNTYKGAEKKKK
ncbi:MFS-type transporter clz9-like protein [Cladobotryum mycophilum]|uniref:MFS-type transporter clz9-like protein n=1 Tax=Cladobotryum mycophilum TaxID=491253 RepID=A0ABR0SWF9_9HYPO